MSLIVYLSRSAIPKEKEVIYNNAAYFDLYSLLPDTELSKIILQRVDKAIRVSDSYFDGRNVGHVGTLGKEYLSTGAKTLLNISQHCDKVFTLVSCGYSALNLLPLFTSGEVLWELPATMYAGPFKCDIICENEHFTDFYKFLKWVRLREEGADDDEF